MRVIAVNLIIRLSGVGLQRGSQIDCKYAEIQTPGGIQGVHLLTEDIIAE